MSYEKIPHNCSTCADYIVCWSYGKLKEDKEKIDCPDWKMDFMLFQELWENTEQ